MGMGVQYPHLWTVIKRYILRGDQFFQSGGLTTLAAVAWSLPLTEACDVLEEYYAKYGYWPPYGQTARINLSGLKAIHAVGTIPVWMGGEEAVSRQIRMLALLDRIEDRAWRTVPQDAAIVDEVRTAMRGDKPWDRQDFDVTRNGNGPAREPAGLVPVGPSPDVPEVKREEVEIMIMDAIGQTLRNSTVSQMDIITAKHGNDLLEQRITLRDRAIDDRLAAMDKTIDRTLATKQIDVGTRQITWTKWAIVLGAAGAVIGGVVVILIARAFGWMT